MPSALRAKAALGASAPISDLFEDPIHVRFWNRAPASGVSALQHLSDACLRCQNCIALLPCSKH